MISHQDPGGVVLMEGGGDENQSSCTDKAMKPHVNEATLLFSRMNLLVEMWVVVG